MSAAVDIDRDPAPRERPILFSGPMVRAILAGRKTQTRRVVKPEPARQNGREAGDVYVSAHGDYPITVNVAVPGGYRPVPLRCPYGAPGNRLWVREAFALRSYDCPVHDHGGDYPAGKCDCEDKRRVCYRVDAGAEHAAPWRPSIHMPRWASRITLEVTAVRVERLADITEEDARAEGVEGRGAFVALWDSLNGKRAPFASSPWVWVVSFRRMP